MSKLEKKKELQKLITAGKEKGFLTYEEINEALPEEITESDDLDEVMALIEDADPSGILAGDVARALPYARFELLEEIRRSA